MPGYYTLVFFCVFIQKQSEKGILVLFFLIHRPFFVLYRMEEHDNCYYLFVKSKSMPMKSNLLYIVKQVQMPDDLSFIQSGRTFNFKLRTVPGFSLNGRLHYFKNSETTSSHDLRMRWLTNRLEKAGCRLLGARELEKDNRFVGHSNDKGGKMSISMWDYSGSIVVEDEGLFKKAYRNGLGRSKAYGAGMLVLS